MASASTLEASGSQYRAITSGREGLVSTGTVPSIGIHDGKVVVWEVVIEADDEMALASEQSRAVRGEQRKHR